MASKKELTKEERISREVARLAEIYRDVDDKKRETLEGIINECAFMRVTLEDLRKEINEKGFVDEMPQGEYSIIRESPYVKTYHTMIQRYTTANDKLLGLLPKSVQPEDSDDVFDDFVSGREDD